MSSTLAVHPLSPPKGLTAISHNPLPDQQSCRTSKSCVSRFEVTLDFDFQDGQKPQDDWF
jgi:hypothetical protein